MLAAAAPLGGTGIKGLFSRADKVIEGFPKKINASRALSQLKNQASGEELSYRKLDEFLKGKQGQPIEAEQIREVASQNPLNLSVKELSGLEPRFSRYTLPGGSDYRETLISLNTPEERAYQEALKAYDDAGGVTSNLGSELDKRATELEMNTFRSQHWDDPNILAHVRYNERRLPATPEEIPEDILSGIDPNSFGSKGRFIEEIQSDWHEQGRDRGYRTPELERQIEEANSALGRAEAARLDYVHANPDVIGSRAGDFPELDRLWRERRDAEEALQTRNRERRQAVPDAPFKESWPDLALKQQIMDVVDRPDLDWLGFTTGQTQIDRYDLSQSVNRILYDPDQRVLEVFDNNMGHVATHAIEKPEDLIPLIGKDAADRLMANPIPGHEGFRPVFQLAGVDLQIGGGGMTDFYDRQLPERLGKILKPFGGKVELGSLGNPTQFDQFGVAKTTLDQTPEEIEAWIARLTPEMKAAIKEKGLPLIALLMMLQGENVINQDQP